VLRYEEFAGKFQSPTTPAVSLLFALDKQLEDIERETLARRFARHKAMLESCTSWVTRAEAASLGISLLSRPGFFSPSVTAIRSERSGDIIKGMREQGFELGGGQPPLTKTMFRIGHMGDHSVRGLEAMLKVLDQVLRNL
jgi:aspartate aminotransferase-like enzyme